MREALHCLITAACTTPARNAGNGHSSSYCQHLLYETVQLVCIAFWMAGCAPRPTPICEANKSVRVFQAADIDHDVELHSNPPGSIN